jgi:uncharacterized protein YfcZ (UPF0381/DUF406 family)
MTDKHLSLLMLIGFAANAAAQNETNREDGSTDPTLCRSTTAASRARSTCDEEHTTVLSSKVEVTTKIELPQLNTRNCSAQIDLQYSQRNTIARVLGKLTNESCAASSGQYVIAARIRNENGEFETLEFDETWQRDDDQPVMLTADYAIGENAELIRLSSRRILCRCADVQRD